MSPIAQTLEFDSLESMCAAAASWDWGLDFTQLDGGVFSSRFQRVDGGAMGVLRLEVGRRILQRGQAPAGLITFGIAANCIGDMSWNIKDVDSAMLLEFSTGSEFEGISSPGFVCYTLNFSPEKLAAVAENYGIDVSIETLGIIDRVSPIHPKTARTLLQQLDLVTSHSPGHNEHLDELMEDSIPVLLLTVLEEVQLGRGIKLSTTNIAGFKRAREYLESSAGEKLVVAELCRESGMNVRTLQRCFRRYFDLTPREYQQVFRLKCVRQDLLAAGSIDTVSDVALRNGFAHLGRFSSQYLKQFGELPRQTIRRSFVPVV